MTELMPYSALFSAGFSLISAVFSGMLFIYTQVRGAQLKVLLPDQIGVFVPKGRSDLTGVLLAAGFECTGVEKSSRSVQRILARFSSSKSADTSTYRWAVERKFVEASSQPVGPRIVDDIQYVSRVSQFVISAQSSVVKLIEFWPVSRMMQQGILSAPLKLRLEIESDNGTITSSEREYVCSTVEPGIYSWCYQR